MIRPLRPCTKSGHIMPEGFLTLMHDTCSIHIPTAYHIACTDYFSYGLYRHSYLC